METVGTVNFEDLFDFSPEPLSPEVRSCQEICSVPHKNQFPLFLYFIITASPNNDRPKPTSKSPRIEKNSHL